MYIMLIERKTVAKAYELLWYADTICLCIWMWNLAFIVHDTQKALHFFKHFWQSFRKHAHDEQQYEHERIIYTDAKWNAMTMNGVSQINSSNAKKELQKM